MRLSPFQCAAVIHQGGVVLYPTEGVWGLGCDPLNDSAIARVLDIKQREPGKGLILVAANLEQLNDFVDWSQVDASSITGWPGFVTWILPAAASTSKLVTGDHETVACRVSDNETVRALCNAIGGALISTSANIAGDPSPQQFEAVDAEITSAVDAICEGETGCELSASPIRDALSGDVIR
jgi:L-threonylcarbamoyladenylate synthase